VSIKWLQIETEMFINKEKNKRKLLSQNKPRQRRRAHKKTWLKYQKVTRT